jgi:hypothetical protein
MELNNMIQKVSQQERADMLDSGSSFERESMNKSAMSSFESILKKQASGLAAKGLTSAQIAQKFNLTPDVIETLLSTEKTASAEPEQKIACSCENETSDGDKALEAYNELHGKKAIASEDYDYRTGKSIHSASGNQSVSDMGGPKKQIKFQSSNSIWDSEVLDRQLKETGSDERIKSENKKIAETREENKQISRYETISGESLADALKETDQRKAGGVSSAFAQEAHKYSNKLPMKGMSIFDTSEFQRVAERTAGEQLKVDKIAAANKPKDRSWLETKSVTSKNIFNSMIDSLIDDKE